jgi:hypothetical protein
MASLEIMLALLARILREPLTRKATVKQFQSLVWQGQERSIDKDTYNVLADLAYDLDFYEPDPVLRKEDATYYGQERLEREVKAALRRLADLGIELPRDLPIRE